MKAIEIKLLSLAVFILIKTTHEFSEISREILHQYVGSISPKHWFRYVLKLVGLVLEKTFLLTDEAAETQVIETSINIIEKLSRTFLKRATGGDSGHERGEAGHTNKRHVASVHRHV